MVYLQLQLEIIIAWSSEINGENCLKIRWKLEELSKDFFASKIISMLIPLLQVIAQDIRMVNRKSIASKVMV